MDEKSNRPTQRLLIDALDASVRDIAEGRVHDARTVQAEARRMLADHDDARSGGFAPHRDRTAWRTRSAS